MRFVVIYRNSLASDEESVAGMNWRKKWSSHRAEPDVFVSASDEICEITSGT